jgi:hypothetical protein
MTIIQMELCIGQRNLICKAQVEENQRVIWSILKCVDIRTVALMKGIKFASKAPTRVAIRVIKEVHSIGPVILKFESHCLTKACAGEILILLTMAYSMSNSMLRTGRTSSLGKRVMANYLCIN